MTFGTAVLLEVGDACQDYKVNCSYWKLVERLQETVEMAGGVVENGVEAEARGIVDNLKGSGKMVVAAPALAAIVDTGSQQLIEDVEEHSEEDIRYHPEVSGGNQSCRVAVVDEATEIDFVDPGWAFGSVNLDHVAPVRFASVIVVKRPQTVENEELVNLEMRDAGAEPCVLDVGHTEESLQS